MHLAKLDLLERLKGELHAIHRLCSAIPDCDASGKLRGKLTRLQDSLMHFQATGDLSDFRGDLDAAEACVRDQHSRDPLTQMLERLSSLHRTLAVRNSGA